MFKIHTKQGRQSIRRSFLGVSRNLTTASVTPFPKKYEKFSLSIPVIKPRFSSIPIPVFQPLRNQSSASKTRDPRFKKLELADVEYFRSILPPGSVLSSPEFKGNSTEQDLLPYNTPVYTSEVGHAQVVLLPTCTLEFTVTLEPIVPQGGNTGTLAGSMTVYDEIAINMSKMNSIRSLDENAGVLVCDAGCILEELDKKLNDHGLCMPVDLGAKGSCHIGGNVSTNAGGIRLIKYGSLHGSVLGLEVVLPNGKILDNLSILRKDNTGYDIKQLFIGAEGTLGIITGVSILAAKKPKATHMVIFCMNSYEKVLLTFKKAKEHLSEILSAFEYCDATSMNITLDTQNKHNTFKKKHNYYVFIETGGSNQQHDQEKITDLFEDLQGSNTIEEGIFAQDSAQITKLWEIREFMILSHNKIGDTYTLDLSIPIDTADKAVQDLKKFLTESKYYDESLPVTNDKFHVKCVTGFGHIGDGNLHLNIVVDKYRHEFTELLEKFVFEYVKNLKGSISAEHGIGLLKPDFLHYSKSSEAIELMQTIKKAIDPKGIMNPYKVLP
ncbi:hypothetical protein BB560_000189 [Smittium megazygosporum]|uniref:FAD-binding PCMH-type domain-containing protein n=1 Tax=Smittium megazygosporum TaxID=133381 RepID=A0A2T9ZL32_9FUNG|nr:hypothetical protein BB560_000189 [Smittium megazygosporum]